MKRNGFTLFELMITVAIFGILLAVIFPMFQRDRGYVPVPVPETRSTVVERVSSQPRCLGGFIVSADGTVQVKDGSAIKC